jgi:hypothetical protein
MHAAIPVVASVAVLPSLAALVVRIGIEVTDVEVGESRKEAASGYIQEDV